MSASREPTPIYGFENGQPVGARTRRQNKAAAPSTSSIEEHTTRETIPLRRQKKVSKNKPEVADRRVAVSETPSESDVNTAADKQPSVSDLEWDNNPDQLNLSGQADAHSRLWTTSTQFNVSIGTRHSEAEDNSDSSDECFEIAEVSPNNSGQTVRAMPGRVEEDPGLGAGAAAGDDQSSSEEDLNVSLEPWTKIYKFKINGTAEVKKHFKAVKIAYMSWNDDFNKVDPKKLTSDRLKQRLTKAEELKITVRDAILELEDAEPEGWTPEVEEAVNSLNQKYARFIRQADSMLHRIDTSGSNDKVNSVKARRVKENIDAVTNDLDNIKITMEAQASGIPEDEPTYMLHFENVTTMREKAKTAMDDAKDLMVDATDSALAVEADRLDKAIRAVKRADNELHTKLTDRKTELGVLTNTSNLHKTDVPAPKFSGSAGGIDYYTFMKEWKLYLNSRQISKPERFNVLTRLCLTGPAKNVSERCNTVDEVMEELKTTFGNPLYLFSAKGDEIRKIGAPGNSNIRRREWAVDIRSRLEDLEKLCNEHGLQEKLHNCPLVKEIQEYLPVYAVREYKKVLKRGSDDDRKTAKFFWVSLVKYLSSYITELTFDIDYDITCGNGRKDSNTNGHSTNAVKSGEKSFGKKGGHKVFLAVESEEKLDAEKTKPKRVEKKKNTKKKTEKGSERKQDNYAMATVKIPANYVEPKSMPCAVCTSNHTFLFYCVNFQQAREVNRINVGAKNKVCFRCLRMDSQIDLKNREAWWKNHENNCVTQWACTQGDCEKTEKKRQYSFLMCSRHVEENKERERSFIQELDQTLITPGVRFFLNFHAYQLGAQPCLPPSNDPNIEDDLPNPSIFLLQYIEHEGEVLLVFFDTGCAGSALSHRAASILNSTTVREGPTNLCVAGGTSFEIEGGDESFRLPLVKENKFATLTGLKMENITGNFPCWDIVSAWDQITQELDEEFPGHEELPLPPDKVGGGPVDVMVGIRYAKLFPTLMYMLPSGLGIYETKIKGHNGKNCVLGGSHHSWRHSKDVMNFLSPRAFFSAEMRAYSHSCSTIQHVYSPPGRMIRDEEPEPRVVELHGDDDQEVDQQGGPNSPLIVNSYSTDTSVFFLEDSDPDFFSRSDLEPTGVDPWDLEGICFSLPEEQVEDREILCAYTHCKVHEEQGSYCIPQNWNVENTIYSLREDASRFLGGELVGSEITYRCVACRNCTACKNAEAMEASSLREEQEQFLIEDSITFIPEEKRLVSFLPFISDPSTELKPNRYNAEKVFQSQMKKVQSSNDVKEDVLASFNKLADRGYLAPLSSLSETTQKLIKDEKDPGYWIPWRTVYKENSLSTPVRLVFDASARTPGGASLNETLAKGQNRLASIHNILQKFRNKSSAFACDIRLAYNQIQLAPEHMRYQKFLWSDQLSPENPPEPYIITTLIYGVKPAGNSLQAGFDKLSKHCRDTYPEHASGADALSKSAYVDDVCRSDDSPEESKKTAASLDFVLSQAGMEVKGYTFSGQPPPADVSANGESIGLVGMAWFPEKDEISLEIKPLYFGKAKRGKLPPPVEGDIRPHLAKNFTRRNLLGKVAGIFDPLGLVTPISARLKLDLHDLVELKMDWDTLVPDSYLEQWVKNIEDIQDLREIRFRRTIIPEDAVNTDVELVVSADASQFIAIACIHARVKRKNGLFSSQLISAKSKLVKEHTIPKGELRAAVLATHLAHAAKFNLGSQFKSAMYITDSSIALFWINLDTRPLNVTVRNCVVDIRRFSSPSQWYHIESALNIADIGTRYAEVSETGPQSNWQNGMPWMSMEKEKMPIKTMEQIKMSQEDSRIASQEIKNNNVSGIVLPMLVTKVADRYAKMKYIYDPNKYGWKRSVTIVSIMLKFITVIHPGFKPEWEPRPSPDNDSVVLYRGEAPVLRQLDLHRGERYFFALGTKEVERFATAKELQDTDKQNGILYYAGRILDGEEIATPVGKMFDVTSLNFVKPVLDRYSPIAYAIMCYVHTELVHHASAVTTLRESRNLAYILRGRDLAKEIKSSCRACIRYRAQLVKAEMGKIDQTRLTVSPPFYLVQVDLFGPLLAKCQHNHRSQVKVWGATFKDPASAAIAVYAMQGYSTGDFIQAYTRFSSRYGHPNQVLIDEGSQLAAACKKMEISLVDLTNNLSTSFGVGVKFATAPVGGHNVTGMVERGIRSVQDLFKKVFSGIKLDILALETAFSWVANSLNNLPICLGSRTEHLGNLDIITPSRLILGRSSSRAAAGHTRISPPSKQIEQMDEVYQAWWSVWEREKITDFIPQIPGWKESDNPVKEGDVVLVLQNPDEARLGGQIWRIAKVSTVETSAKDGQVRVAVCEYRIPGEKGTRFTRRSVRKLAVLHSEDQLDCIQELNLAAKEADIAFYLAEAREPEDHIGKVGI